MGKIEKTEDEQGTNSVLFPAIYTVAQSVRIN